MKIPRDKLSNYLDEDERNARFDNWLFYFIRSDSRSAIDKAIGGSSSVRNAMADALGYLGIRREVVISARGRCLIRDSAFDWFECSKRFFKWICSQRFGDFFISPPLPDDNPLKLGFKELCVALIDVSNEGQGVKIEALRIWQAGWMERVAIGKVFSWTEGKEEKNRCELAYKEVLKFRQTNSPFFPFVSSYGSQPFPENFQDFLVAIDGWNISLQEAKAASKEAKAKLSQKKFRSKEDKKQLNVHISTEAIGKLEKLANEHNLSKPKIVEFLINEEFKRKQYIPEKMAAWLRGDVPSS